MSASPSGAGGRLAAVVDAERARRGAAVLRQGAAWAAAGAALLFAVAAVSLGGGRWLDLPRWAPVFAWTLFAGCVALAAWAALARSRAVTADLVAADAERERGLRAGAVRGALEAASAGPLGALAADRLAAGLGDVRALAPATAEREARRSRRASGVGALAVAVALLAAARWGDGARAVVHPVSAWRGTLAEPLALEAPDAVVRGAPVAVRVRAPGRRRVWVESRQTGEAAIGAWHPVVDGIAQVAVGAARADVRVRAHDGRAGAVERTVRVTDRAFVGEVAVRAEYPAYLGRAAENLDPAGELRVPRGTQLRLTAAATAALRSLVLVSGRDTLPLRASGRGFAATLEARGDGAWSWAADAGGAVDLPAPLRLSVVLDSAPTVELASDDSVVIADGDATLRVSAGDDHGLAGVTLRAWRAPARGNAGEQRVALLAAPAPSLSAERTLSLGTFGLGAGDAVHVVAEAVDASPWHQRTSSRELVLRVPSQAEGRTLARAAGDSLSAAAGQAARAARLLEQRTAEAARSRGARSGATQSDASDESGARSRAAAGPPPGTMDNASAEKAKAIAADQRAMADKVDKLRQQARSLEGQLRQAGALDTGLASQLREAQQMLKDALTPQMRDQLTKLESSTSQLDAEGARAAMADLQKQQQQMREQLERSAEMLKRAALEGSMETLRDEARDVAKQQRALAGDPPSPQDASRGAQQSADKQGGQSPQQSGAAQRPDEKGVAARARQLGDDVRALQKRLENAKAEPGAQSAEAAADRADRSAKLSERAAQSAKDGDDSRSAQRGAPQQSAQRQAGEQRGQEGAQQQGGQQQSGQQQSGQQQGAQQSGAQRGDEGQRGAADASRQAAAQMDSAAARLQEAREKQVAEWKKDLTQELDRSVQEMLQMARAEEDLAKRQEGKESGKSDDTGASSGSQGQGAQGSGTTPGSKPGSSPGGSSEMRGAQSSLQQGVERTAERLQNAARKSSLVSGGSQRAVSEAREKVADATRQTSAGGQGQGSPQQTAQAMRDAASALNQAAASLVRDRARANSAGSASGFSEMVQEMKDLAQQQGALNAAASGLSLGAGKPGQGGGPSTARELAKQQRGVADALDELGDADGSGRASALAQEAKRLAQALESGPIDAATLQRQQQLYRRLLDAGRTMERDEPDTQGPREARAATGTGAFAPGTADASGRAGARFREPTWNELRGLTPEERQLVLDYFKRLNAAP